jgi:hypothetical protein
VVRANTPVAPRMMIAPWDEADGPLPAILLALTVVSRMVARRATSFSGTSSSQT